MEGRRLKEKGVFRAYEVDGLTEYMSFLEA
jgi:hypothetical protein